MAHTAKHQGCASMGEIPPADKGDVAQVAYELYKQCGCTTGHDLQHWLKAEEIVKQRLAKGQGCKGG